MRCPLSVVRAYLLAHTVAKADFVVLHVHCQTLKSDFLTGLSRLSSLSAPRFSLRPPSGSVRPLSPVVRSPPFLALLILSKLSDVTVSPVSIGHTGAACGEVVNSPFQRLLFICLRNVQNSYGHFLRSGPTQATLSNCPKGVDCFLHCPNFSSSDWPSGTTFARQILAYGSYTDKERL